MEAHSKKSKSIVGNIKQARLFAALGAMSTLAAMPNNKDSKL